VSTAINSAINVKLNAALAKIPSETSIGGGKSESDISVYFSNISVGTTPVTCVTVSDFSEFQDNKTSELCPHDPSATIPFIASTTDDAMLQLLLADNWFTCAFWVANRNGALNFTVPAGNTSSWELLIPQLNKLYPDHSVSIDISPESDPDLRCTAIDGLLGTAVLKANSSVIDPVTGNKTYTHTLHVETHMGFDIFLAPDSNSSSDSKIVGNITALNLNITVEDSAIGHISDITLGGLAKLIGPFFRSLVNRVINVGFPVPALGPVNVAGSQVSTRNDGYLVISGNMSLNTTSTH
jgi:hypothetical protein